MELARFNVRRLRRPRCPEGQRFGPAYSEHRLCGAFSCVSPAAVGPGAECEIKVVAFQRDPRCDPVRVRVKLHGSDRLHWPDRKRPKDVTRKSNFDLAQTTDDVKSAKSYGLGSWGAFATVRMIARNHRELTAVRHSRIDVETRIGTEDLPVIQARAELTE